MQIVQLTASNVKRLTAISIKPDGSTIVIGGRHANGKSSVLDSILYALGGTAALPPVPLRTGQSKGYIDLDLGELKVRRTFTRKGEADYTTSLEVKRANGDKVTSPQALLDSLCGKLAFDPLEFSRMKPKAQLESLKALVGIDFTKLDQERAAIFSQRTEVNRQCAAAKATLAATPKHEGIPAAEVSISERLAALKAAEKVNNENFNARKLLAWHEQNIADKAGIVAKLQEQLKAAMVAAQEAVTKAAAHRETVEALPADVDVDSLAGEVSDAEGINRKVRQNQQRETLEKSFADLSDQGDDLTRKLQTIDDCKAEAMKAAKFPVDGLGFGSDGVLLNGLPLEQANTAAQIQLSVAMGIALNPKLRVMLIREGGSLFADETGLGLIAKLADAANAQVWIERPSLGSECSVIMEDGHAKEIEVPEEAEAETANA